ncbi:CIC11C00000001279 [Sungouiella intermedia]|uniref:CIC11C00000001279 n=1 Tax=Sungouiella intermedia TaxID=45354 RepID=A0A1L0BA71_9ASCO|nr:CIC11C00000001279 [[Candida] intermedia]
MQEPPQRLRGAIIRGNLPITKRLLARFPELWLNIDPNNHGWCNLHYASYHGNYLVCFHLVSLMNRMRESANVCDLDLITFDNLTVLHMPLMNHHSQTLHFLLQEFSGHRWINHRGGPLSRTPLHYCCVHQFADGLKLLLEFGADWTAQDKNGDTCLHLCFEFGHLDGLEELVKFTATRRLKQYLRESSSSDDEKEVKERDLKERELKEFKEKDFKESKGSKMSKVSSDSLSQTKWAIRTAVQDEIAKFENITNNKGWRAEDYSATFEMAKRYNSLKETWIDRAVEEELALRHLTDSDSALSMYVYDPVHDRLAKLSLNSLSSSLHVDTAAGSLTSSLAGDAGVLASPIHLIMQPLLASSRHGSILENLDNSPVPITSNDITEKKGRQHSRSLPGATPEPIAERPPQTRKRSNTSFAFSLRPPQLLATRTPVLASGSMPPPPVTPLLMEMSKLDLSKTPSLKSVTISPLVRYTKRRSSEDLASDIKTEPKLTRFYTAGNPTSMPTAVTGSPSSAVTPTSTRSPFSLSPHKLIQRQRSASTSNAPKSDSYIAARAAAEAAVRSRGSLFRLPQGPSTEKTSKHPPLLKRNASTPVISSFTNMDYASRRMSKQSISDLSRDSLQSNIVLEALSTDGSLDTIDLAAMLLGDSADSSRFVPQLKSSSTTISPEKKLQSSVLFDGDNSNKPDLLFKIPPSQPLGLSNTPKRPSLSQHSTALGNSSNEKISPTNRSLARNVSSISFTRVRDE